YLKAFRSACDQSAPKVEMWAALECFEGNPARPAGIERLRRQFQAARPYASRLLAYDFYHYMNPKSPHVKVGEDWLARGSLTERARLYNAYRQALPTLGIASAGE